MATSLITILQQQQNRYNMAGNHVRCTVLTVSCGSGSGDSGGALIDEEIPAVITESNEIIDEEVVEITEGETPSNPEMNESENTEAETEETVELTPIALLLEEVRLAAADPVNTINGNLTSGVALTQEQNECLGTFDPAVGEQLTQIDCGPFDTSVSVFESDLQAIAVTLDPSAECQASLLQGLTDNCILSDANLLLPIDWVAIENPSPGQIATLTPIDGARFEYNLQEEGRLIFESVSDLFTRFRCEVDISGGFLVDTESSQGNCEAETSRLINRLFALRTGL